MPIQRQTWASFCPFLIFVILYVWIDIKELFEENETSGKKKHEARQIRKLGTDSVTSTAQEIRPNILLMILDQWRFDWDGITKKTPAGRVPLYMPFMQHAARQGIRFTQAYVPSPLCAPVRACLAAGKEYEEAGVLQNHADHWPLEQTTFYKQLRDAGHYHVIMCGKDDLHKQDVNFPYYLEDADPGLVDLGFSDAIRTAGKTKVIKEHLPWDAYRTFLQEKRLPHLNGTSSVTAFRVYSDCWDANNKSSTLCTTGKFTSEIYPDDYVMTQAIQLLDRKPSSSSSSEQRQPWFMQVNFPGPHPPILATQAMANSVASRKWPDPFYIENPKKSSPSPNYDKMECPQGTGKTAKGPQFGGRCNYAAQLENIDKLMQKIVDHVKEMNELDDTIVCVTGDHGEMLGDHGMQAKKLPWQASVSVPLICFGPGIAQGVEYHDPVTTLDLPGTFMDVAGVSPSEGMTTQSMLHLMQTMGSVSKQQQESTPRREFVASGLSDGMHTWRLVVKVIDDISYKLICCKKRCAPSPPNVPPPTSDKWHMLLYDTTADPLDAQPITDKPEIVKNLRQHLPQGWCDDGDEDDELIAVNVQ